MIREAGFTNLAQHVNLPIHANLPMLPLEAGGSDALVPILFSLACVTIPIALIGWSLFSTKGARRDMAARWKREEANRTRADRIRSSTEQHTKVPYRSSPGWDDGSHGEWYGGHRRPKGGW